MVETLESRGLMASLVLMPAADNTLFQDQTANSNGAGQYLFAGEAADGFGARRALVRFDVAASLPASAHINSVTLEMHVSQAGGGSTEFGLYRLAANWGEGTSNAGDPGDQGALAATGDATWLARFFNAAPIPSQPWTTAGGDFAVSPSANVLLAGTGFYQWSSSALTADAQSWLNSSSTQFGWLLKAVDESVPGTTARFDSRESSTADNRPTLTIEYSLSANQPPSFLKGADVSANDSSGPVSVVGWATNISPGPSDEADQSVQFIVNNDRPELFAAGPQIDPAGKLSFTPAPNAHGTAHLSIQLQDDGGTLSGGHDISPAQTADITINKPLVWHNTLHPLDVTDSAATGTDDKVSAVDALAIINYINSAGAGRIPAGAPFGPPYLDTSDSAGNLTGDGSVAAGDALVVINFINVFGGGQPAPGGEGEAALPSDNRKVVETAAPAGASFPPAAYDILLLALAGNESGDYLPPTRRRR
jgi:hypothetical protein